MNARPSRNVIAIRQLHVSISVTRTLILIPKENVFIFGQTINMKKDTVKKAKAYAWGWMSKYIRLRDSDDGKTAVCCTSGKRYPIKGKGCVQAGHFIPGRSNAILYDERNCHAQCYVDNCYKNGAWVEYLEFMLDRYGEEVVEELKRMKNEIKPMTPAEHREMGDYYKQKVKELGGW